MFLKCLISVSASRRTFFTATCWPPYCPRKTAPWAPEPNHSNSLISSNGIIQISVFCSLVALPNIVHTGFKQPNKRCKIPLREGEFDEKFLFDEASPSMKFPAVLLGGETPLSFDSELVACCGKPSSFASIILFFVFNYPPFWLFQPEANVVLPSYRHSSFRDRPSDIMLDWLWILKMSFSIP